MSRCKVAAFCLVVLTLPIPASADLLRSSLAWSPDGDWLAYASETTARPVTLDTSWIFEGKDAGDAPRSSDGRRRRHRLWATRIGSEGASILLDDSPGPITPPCWRPDGKALAYGRVVPTAVGRARFEVVRIEGEDRRVLHSQALDDPDRDARSLVGSPVAWSPDGRFLAVPRVRPSGLAILRVDTGAILKSIEGATAPAWAPIGGRLFYVVATGGKPASIECLESHLGAARRMAEIGQLESPLVVARDGQSVILISRSPVNPKLLTGPEKVEVVRIRVDEGQGDRTVPTAGGPLIVDRGLVAASLAQDRDGENLFSVVAGAGQPCQVSWFRPRERSVHKLFPVLDPTLAVGDLALSPRGETLALRLGEPGSSGVVALCDLQSMALTPVASDDPARDAWLTLLLATSRKIVREGLPAPILGGRAIDRAVAPPIPGELEANSETQARLHRLARTARLCLGPVGPGSDDVAHEEARFLFDFLREDYPAAMVDVDRLAAIEPDAGRRLKVVGLRGQVYAGMGDLPRARDAFAYLKVAEARSRSASGRRGDDARPRGLRGNRPRSRLGRLRIGPGRPAGEGGGRG